MTTAVCIQCGQVKVGAFVTCGQCRFTPKDPEDLAKSVRLSDQVADETALLAAGKRLRSGESIAYDPQAVAQLMTAIRANPSDLKMPLGCALIWYSPIVIMVLLFFALVGVIIYLKWWAA